MMHENLHFSKQILHNFFQNFLFSIPWKIHEKPLSFCQPFYWPWIFNLHFSLEPGIVEACNMAHLNPVSLKINLVGWNPPFMPLFWSKCEKNEFFQYFSRRWARCFRLEMSLENMFWKSPQLRVQVNNDFAITALSLFWEVAHRL